MQERMASVMRRALPETVLAFLSPSGNCYNERLAPRGPLHCAADAPAPFDEIAELLRLADKKKTSGLVAEPELLQGSNAWVVGGRKTGDGRAIMANDMHLGLSAPGIFYRAELNYGGVRLGGLTVPGAPLVVTGSNGSVAWGFTSVAGDFIDLVRVEPTAEIRRNIAARRRSCPLSRGTRRSKVNGGRRVSSPFEKRSGARCVGEASR